MAAGAPVSASRAERGLRLGLGLALGLLVLRVLWLTAWQGDDAFITHRTAANLLTGHGLTWNPGERVQAFTHPLWLLVSVLGHLLTGEAFYSVLGLSALLLCTAFVLVARQARSTATGLLLVGVLSASAAVVDWGVSGLENPLFYVLVALLPSLADGHWDRRRAVLAGLLGSVLALTRPDAPLVMVPLVGWVLWEVRRDRPALVDRALGLALGALPLVAWELFSLVYYGSLVPNTAWAKLNVDISGLVLARQGLVYVADGLLRDPVCLLVPLLATALVRAKGSAREKALAAGIWLYLAYVVRIGGDFMALRFLAAPTVLGAALLARGLPKFPPHHQLILALGLVGLGTGLPGSPWHHAADDGVDAEITDIVDESGIADERRWYYPETGLARVWAMHEDLVSKGVPVPPHVGARAGAQDRQAGRPHAVRKDVGYYGYFAGPSIYVVDLWALADPFLARVPFRPEDGFRIGHYGRTPPPGMFASLEQGQAAFGDPALDAAWTDLRLVVAAPLSASGRAGAIWRLNTGAHDDAFESLASGEDARPVQ